MAVRTPFNRRRSSNPKTNRSQGDTLPGNESGGAAPRLPHERDESSDSQDSAPRADIQQAHKDVQRGLVDTDRGPVTDATYKKLKGDAQ